MGARGARRYTIAMRNRALLVALLFVVACASAPPSIPKNRYGLEVVSDVRTYQRLAREDHDKQLVDASVAIPGVAIDVRYATTNNFMHAQLYRTAKVYLRVPVAAALREVENELAHDGLGLRLYDGYRPYRITEKMWEPYKDPDYVADPAKGSRHNRGAAVDLTLIDLRTGNEVPMPTPYDDFTRRAWRNFNDLPPEVLANRTRLESIMTRHGFEPLPSEWWHFDYHGWTKFELLDIPFEELP